MILTHREKLMASGELQAKRRKQALDWMWSLVDEGLKTRFYNHPAVKDKLSGFSREVEKGLLAPTIAASELLFLLDKEDAV